MQKIVQLVRKCGPYLLIIGLWIGTWVWGFGITGESASAERGQFGDKFGAVNALFTGLALAGLLYSYRQQRDTIQKQDEHFSQTAYLNALVARIEGYSVQIELYPGVKPKLVHEQDELLHELHDALNRYRRQAGAKAVSREDVERRNSDRFRDGTAGIAWVD